MPKTIEIRRHSLRIPPNPHLSQQGVTLARLVGESMGPFDRVVTSTAPRAFETAIAMGFAVDAQEELLSTYGVDVESALPWPQAFAAYQAARRHPAVERYTRRLSAFYTALANYLAEGRAALVVNHGGVVELSAVACLPDAGYGAQDAVSYCEGVRLRWEAGAFSSMEFIRIP